jgi:hypothetical protein
MAKMIHATMRKFKRVA